MASFSLNKVQLIGNLGADPVIRHTQDGRPIANLSIATSESWKDAQGAPQERTEWHRVVVFGKLAEFVQQYYQKGRKVYAEGRLQTRKWTDPQGVEKYNTEIVVGGNSFDGSTIFMLDGQRGQGGEGGYPAGAGGYGGGAAAGGGYAPDPHYGGMQGAPAPGGYVPTPPPAVPPPARPAARRGTPPAPAANSPAADEFGPGGDFNDDIPF